MTLIYSPHNWMSFIVRVFLDTNTTATFFRSTSIIRKVSVLAFLLVLFISKAYSFQTGPNGIISGVVKTQSGAPIAFATVRLLSLKDSVLVKGAIADSSGRFEFRGLSFGKYLIGLTSVSSKTYYSSAVEINSENPNFSLGDIFVEDKLLTMQEVVVTASKPMIEIKGDKMIVNINSSFLAAGNTMGEVLQNLPGVTKSARGMELNGKPALILIDGKGQYNARNVSELLTTLGADKVENVEIISNPSAKYDADIQGIINIKLKKESSISTARINYGQPLYPDPETPGFDYYRLNTGLTLNYKLRALTTTTSIDLTNRNSYEAINEQIALLDEFKVKSYTTRTEAEKYFNYRTDLQFKPENKPNAVYGVTISGFYNFRNRGVRNSVNEYFNYPELTLDSSFNGESINKSKGVNLTNATLYHSNKFEKFSQELDVIYDFYSRNAQVDYLHTNSLFDNGEENPAAIETISAISLDKMQGHAINLNHVIKPSAAFSIESGFKGTFLGVKRDLTYDIEGDTITSGALFDSDFRYRENIYAAYTSFTYAFKTVSTDLGARVEYVDGYGKFTSKDIAIEYFQAYPYANINLTKLKNLSLKVSYARKISRRPNFTELNPAVEYRNPFTLLEGNPALKPTFTNQFNFQAVLASKYSASLFYDLDENIRAIIPSQVQEEDENFVFQTINVKGAKKLGVSINIPVDITKQWSININMSGSHIRVNSSDFDLNTSAYYANLFFNSDYRISPNINLQLIFAYDTPYTSGFNYNGELVTDNLALNFFMLKRALSINLRVTDVLGITKFKFGSEYFGDFEQYTKAATNQRSVNIRVQYNFKTGSKFTSKTKQAKNFGDIRFN